ncbi:MAG TPA: NHL repeat-containing protein, partial [Gammaproteobacteria bacterium]|nr:NHL repeat-containing protein [Gammaproteobacteria bacterium]
MRAKRSLLTMFLALPLVASVSSALAFTTFADEDRSAELAAQPLHQRYQFSSPTTVTYDRDSIKQGSTAGRVYVADMGAYRIRVLDLAGRLIGELNDADQLLAPDSPAAMVPQIKAPLGIAFLSASEAVDQRLAGLYVNDVAVHRIHFFRTDPTNPDKFYYVTSFGQPGNGGGEDLRLPRNMVVTPQGFIYVSDEFNHRIKAFRINPDAAYAVTLIETHGWQDAVGAPLQAGPIIRGVDRNYGDNSTHYEDYASAPEKRDGFRVPQGMTYFRDAGSGATYLYVADNGNNRLKIFRVDPQTGRLALYDMLGRFQLSGQADHLKRPRGVRTDAAGNLYVADSFNGRVLKFPNLASSGAPESVSYRTSRQADAQAQWAYGRLGAHQVEMRTPATAATEDAAFLLPNDVVPLVLADGSLYRENIWAWGYYYQNAQVMLVSDTGNHRIKKCWANSSGTSLLRCSVSKGVGGVAAHEFWGHPRTLAGQLHAVGGMTYLHGSNRLLVSDTSNTRINMYSPAGAYLGRFTGADVSYGVTGLQSFTDSRYGESVAVLVASDATLPWPYTGDSTLRIYDAGGVLKGQYNLT